MADNKRRWVTNATYGCDTNDGLNRCACGNTRFRMGHHTYEDGTSGYMVYCMECGRMAEADGKEKDVIDAWNRYNDGVCRSVYRLTKVPETITVYARADEDMDEVLKEALFQKISLQRVPESSEQ